MFSAQLPSAAYYIYVGPEHSAFCTLLELLDFRADKTESTEKEGKGYLPGMNRTLVESPDDFVDSPVVHVDLLSCPRG